MSETSILISVGSVFFLLIFSGFFSGSETALTATSRARMHALERDGSKRAGVVNGLIEFRERLIGAILLGNNLVNILASAIATSVFLDLFGEAGVVYATLVMTALVLIFAEVLPKTYAITNPDRMALAVAPLIRIAVFTFAPVTAAVQFIVRRTLRMVGANIEDGAEVLSAHEELRGAIDLHHKEGGMGSHDRHMLGGILDLRDLEVDDVMIHRKNMQALSLDDDPKDIVEQVLASPYTRIPLWEEDPDNIVGVLHAKDLLRALISHDGDPTELDIKGLATEAWFVPETTSLVEQLNAFRRRKSHFALVVDEYGSMMGLVTLEDIIEEIVGEISDEHDVEVKGLRPQPDGTCNVDGTLAVRDLNRALDWELPEEEAITVAGLVIHEAQTIPEVGQTFSFYGYKFQVLRRHRNQVTAIKITPPRKAQVAE
ncbi:Transporter associated domain [Candidatus Phaeomarinobacter ectocarpi]|uniref:Transporter associated domain n=1 Tax=Candidatus Phaeomarinibacter ectocarpi TaxID=1458461 RepID=X5MED0_9HYPH|nr:HlyC/CorC family transporter [Candidatus Phaeomarinobacter ectocarpi]CDO59159.1 Transporter associated domain [Candidatus Phaeomarinobacter ectocarpi]